MPQMSSEVAVGKEQLWEVSIQLLYTKYRWFPFKLVTTEKQFQATVNHALPVKKEKKISP